MGRRAGSYRDGVAVLLLPSRTPVFEGAMDDCDLSAFEKDIARIEES